MSDSSPPSTPSHKAPSDTGHELSGHQTDTLYATSRDQVTSFTFDRHVVDVFPDMIKRSVPGYATILHMIAQLSARYAKHDTHLYDLGCSLGAATLAMRHRVNAANTRIVAIDNSPDMVARCRQVVAADASEIPVKVMQDDILNVDIERASVCVLNFTLQFVPMHHRITLLEKIYRGMVDGGILIISEKLKFDDSAHCQLMTELHHDFKRSNGYSDMEIAQKRDALENVLIPETFAAHKTRLLDQGFRGVELWFQCFNFASFVAFK